MKECKSPVTVLYFHGGAYYLLDPSTHRPTTKKLAKLTGGRCYSVRYRLAPQNPFPAALLDALVSYLTLLYPRRMPTTNRWIQNASFSPETGRSPQVHPL